MDIVNIFKRKSKELSTDLIPRGVRVTLPRPSDIEVERVSKQTESLKKYRLNQRVDQSVIQDISDRLYGPDYIEYVKAINELNNKFRPRSGKSCGDFYDPNLVVKINS